jgi:hypothetical protein
MKENSKRKRIPMPKRRTCRRGKLAKQQRREAAERRIEATKKITPEEQLKRLDLMFGKDQGAQEERKKLKNRIAERMTKELINKSKRK